MGSVISDAQADAILAVPLAELEQLWVQTTGSVGDQIIASGYAQSLAGNAAGLVQHVTVAADRVVGWAPWQGSHVLEVAGLPTVELVSGLLFRGISGNDLKNITAAEVLALVEVAVKDIILPLLQTLTIIPVVGQILDIVLGFAQAIASLVEMAKASEAAKREESRVPAVVPKAGYDRGQAKAVVQKCLTGDWTSIWLPAQDPVGELIHERGWTCGLVEDGGAFARWRQIGPRGDDAWLIGDRGFGDRGNLGMGAVPGVAEIHRLIQVGGLGLKELGRGVTNAYATSAYVDAGSWLPSASSAALQAWSLVWSTGPALYAVDAGQVETAWRRYITLFLEGVASGSICEQMPADYRAGIRAGFVRRTCGVDPREPDEDVLDQARPILAAAALGERQRAFAARNTIAYVSAYDVPPGLRPWVEERQAAFLATDAACGVDMSLVPTRGPFRSLLELARQRKGAKCYAATGIGGGAALQPSAWDPDAPEVPAVPLAAVPAIPRALLPRASGRASGLGSARGGTSPSSAGGGLGLLAAAVIAGLIFASK